MNIVKTGLVIIVLLFALACNRTGSETATKQPAVVASPAANSTPSTARVNFERHCAVCHGDGGEAREVKIDNKTIHVPSLTKGHALEHTDEQLAKQIADGDDAMPAFKDKLSAAEIGELVAYIRKDFQGK